MLPFFLPLQAAPPPTPAPTELPSPPPGFSTAPPTPAPPQQAYPYPYPYPYQYPQAYPPPQPPPVAPPPRRRPPEPPTSWFVRVQIGLGPPGFSAQTDTLQLEGYSGVKFWADLDGGYLFHPNIGIGAFASLDLLSVSPGDRAPTLHENAYFVGGEVPIKLGERSISFVVTPRIGYAVGRQSLGGPAPFQPALAWGALLSATSFKYHLTGSLGFLRAIVSPPGQAGRDLDAGGLMLLLGGTVDG